MPGSFRLDDSGAKKIISDTAKRDNFLNGVAHEMVANIVLSMENSPATGKVYKRGTKTHTASSPGNPPRVDTGTLVNSISVRNVKNMEYLIGTPIVYGLELEFGIGIAARPWLRPEFEDAKRWIPQAARGQII